MAHQNAPFAPSYGAGVTVAPGSTSANSKIGGTTQTLCLTNLGAYTAYVHCGEDNTVVAGTTDYPIPAGMQVTITKPRDYQWVAYYAATTTSVHVMPGEGY